MNKPRTASSGSAAGGPNAASNNTDFNGSRISRLSAHLHNLPNALRLSPGKSGASPGGAEPHQMHQVKQHRYRQLIEQHVMSEGGMMIGGSSPGEHAVPSPHHGGGHLAGGSKSPASLAGMRSKHLVNGGSLQSGTGAGEHLGGNAPGGCDLVYVNRLGGSYHQHQQQLLQKQHPLSPNAGSNMVKGSQLSTAATLLAGNHSRGTKKEPPFRQGGHLMLVNNNGTPSRVNYSTSGSGGDGASTSANTARASGPSPTFSQNSRGSAPARSDLGGSTSAGPGPTGGGTGSGGISVSTKHVLTAVSPGEQISPKNHSPSFGTTRSPRSGSRRTPPVGHLLSSLRSPLTPTLEVEPVTPASSGHQTGSSWGAAPNGETTQTGGDYNNVAAQDPQVLGGAQVLQQPSSTLNRQPGTAQLPVLTNNLFYNDEQGAGAIGGTNHEQHMVITKESVVASSGPGVASSANEVLLVPPSADDDLEVVSAASSPVRPIGSLLGGANSMSPSPKVMSCAAGSTPAKGSAIGLQPQLLVGDHMNSLLNKSGSGSGEAESAMQRILEKHLPSLNPNAASSDSPPPALPQDDTKTRTRDDQQAEDPQVLPSEQQSLKMRHEKAVLKSSHSSSVSLSLQKNNALLSAAVSKLLSGDDRFTTNGSRLATSEEEDHQNKEHDFEGGRTKNKELHDTRDRRVLEVEDGHVGVVTLDPDLPLVKTISTTSNKEDTIERTTSGSSGTITTGLESSSSTSAASSSSVANTPGGGQAVAMDSALLQQQGLENGARVILDPTIRALHLGGANIDHLRSNLPVGGSRPGARPAVDYRDVDYYDTAHEIDAASEEFGGDPASASSRPSSSASLVLLNVNNSRGGQMMGGVPSPHRGSRGAPLLNGMISSAAMAAVKNGSAALKHQRSSCTSSSSVGLVRGTDYLANVGSTAVASPSGGQQPSGTSPPPQQEQAPLVTTMSSAGGANAPGGALPSPSAAGPAAAANQQGTRVSSAASPKNRMPIRSSLVGARGPQAVIRDLEHTGLISKRAMSRPGSASKSRGAGSFSGDPSGAGPPPGSAAGSTPGPTRRKSLRESFLNVPPSRAGGARSGNPDYTYVFNKGRPTADEDQAFRPSLARLGICSPEYRDSPRADAANAAKSQSHEDSASSSTSKNAKKRRLLLRKAAVLQEKARRDLLRSMSKLRWFRGVIGSHSAALGLTPSTTKGGEDHAEGGGDHQEGDGDHVGAVGDDASLMTTGQSSSATGTGSSSTSSPLRRNSSTTSTTASSADIRGLLLPGHITEVEKIVFDESRRYEFTPRGPAAKAKILAQMRAASRVISDAESVDIVEGPQQLQQSTSPGKSTSSSSTASNPPIRGSLASTLDALNAASAAMIQLQPQDEVLSAASGEQVDVMHGAIQKIPSISTSGGSSNHSNSKILDETTPAPIQIKPPKTKKSRIAGNRHPQSESISLIQSAFPQIFGPSLYFEYAVGIGAPRVPDPTAEPAPTEQIGGSSSSTATTPSNVAVAHQTTSDTTGTEDGPKSPHPAAMAAFAPSSFAAAARAFSNADGGNAPASSSESGESAIPAPSCSSDTAAQRPLQPLQDEKDVEKEQEIQLLRHSRVFKYLKKDAVPDMYWMHTAKVHVYNSVLNSLKKGGLQYVETKKDSINPRFCLIWSAHFKPEKLKTFHGNQKTNHFPYSWYLGRKDLMCRNIMRMRRQWPQEFNITPETFILPEDGKKFIEGVKGGSTRGPTRDLWISKPVSSSCGKGVKIVGAHSTGLERMAKQYRVVQRYVNPPLLIKGYKFDLRLYVVVTSYDPLKVYLFKEGLVRFATEKYTTERRSDLRCRKVHLTNYSVNKKSEKYRKNMDGNGSVNSTPVATGKQAGSVDQEKSAQSSAKKVVAVAATSTPPPLHSRGTPSPSGKGSSSKAAAKLVEEEEEEEEEEDFSKPPMGDEEFMNDDENGAEDDDDDSGDEDDADVEGEEVESKWSLSQLEEYFHAQSLDYDKCFAEIKALVVKTCISVEPTIVSTLHRSTNFENCENLEDTKTCFEIYGFDVLIDANLKPWLLEVNVSPSLSSSSPLDRRIKSMLLADTLTLVGWKPFDAADITKDKKTAAKQRNAKLSSTAKGPNNKHKRLGSGFSNLILGSLEDKKDHAKEFIRQFGELEWRLILDHVDELYRRGDLETLFPRNKEAVLQLSDYLPTPRISNRILAIFYICGGERILRSRTLQEQLGLTYLLQKEILLTAAKV
ncbi:unnamed protein product [Amoebophrya sp. A25]|nr:unnamed protein product [Amoebophrya sp. A25]|eukprot:GSA25T00025423001.1